MAVHPLAQLVKDVQNAADPPLTLAYIARRAGLKYQSLHKLVTSELRAFPDPATISALAVGLGRPESTVIGAIARTLRLNAGNAPNSQDVTAQIRLIAETSTSMSPERRAFWFAIADALEQDVKGGQGSAHDVS